MGNALNPGLGGDCKILSGSRGANRGGKGGQSMNKKEAWFRYKGVWEVPMERGKNAARL